ncbi:DUF1801 domain-containing protein [Chryseotalea sanaruensis]|uniref:DUF1801 domain-containing protein n=1 Tax=Chryseotalea sanaruensis TaxID=2482724 RepID=A0A401UBK9_9BACT|nr:DUF1801 domain-containing protein [Chryseotalea sanaruensis]GCC52269.1 DUF1801 domain-containing protein [Chryseotalea sanaruensis]
MKDQLSNYYLDKDEPVKSCLMALREIILAQGSEIENTLKYGMPFFTYKGKMFCYLWIHKQHNLPYIGFVEGNRLKHPDLLKEKRARMKVLLINPEEDLPIKKIKLLLKEALELYKSGKIKIKTK